MLIVGFSVVVFLSGDGQPILASHPPSQPTTNTRASTAMAAVIPPMQPALQLDSSGGLTGSGSVPRNERAKAKQEANHEADHADHGDALETKQ